MHDREHRRMQRWGYAASVLLHILIVLLMIEFRPIPPSPFAAAGPRTGDDRAAAGGGVQIVAVRAVAAAETEPVELTPVPVEVSFIPVEVVETPPEPAAPAPVVAAVAIDGQVGESQGRGPERGPGTETGTGTGDGGTTDEGRFRVVAPSPRGLLLPPSDRPGRVRGREVGVWVFVTSQGRVVSDSTRLSPSSGDRGFDNRLRDQAAQWRFEPARRGGQAVAEWFQYIITL
jgi:outer membrane biosynthesis protein TonB